MRELDRIRTQLDELMATMTADLNEVGFDVHLEDDDLLGVVLRAHMLVERELTEILEAPLPRPERLRQPWSFIHRLELVGALGIVDEDEMQPYYYLDKLRNRAAHRLNYEFQLGDQQRLVAEMPESLRHAMEVKYGNEEFPEPLRHALKLLVLYIAMRRHGLVAPAARRTRTRLATDGWDVPEA